MKFTWRQAGGLKSCPYFHRWIVDFGKFAIRLHQWHESDDIRAFHDHPYWFITLVLWGGYWDITPLSENEADEKQDTLSIGSVRFRPANHKHKVLLTHKPTWTLLLTGEPTRRWSFYINHKAIKRDKYFAVYGHHPCDPANKSIRIRPDGTRI